MDGNAPQKHDRQAFVAPFSGTTFCLLSKGFMLHCFGKVFQVMMESKSYVSGQAPNEEGKRPDTFEIISSGTNTGIMYATGSAVIGSAVAGPVGAVVGAIVGAIVGGYIGGHKIDNQ
jgi:hypothetical protein